MIDPIKTINLSFYGLIPEVINPRAISVLKVVEDINELYGTQIYKIVWYPDGEGETCDIAYRNQIIAAGVTVDAAKSIILAAYHRKITDNNHLVHYVTREEDLYRTKTKNGKENS